MDFFQYFADNHDHFFYLLAGISFIVELAIIGLGGPLLFFAIASFITGVLISLGLLSGWEMEIFALGVLTALTTLLLWKPLKKFQNSGGGADTSSDMIGKQVPASSEITSSNGTIRYSGIDWNSRLDSRADVDSIADGAQCMITSVDGNVMIVKPVSR
ncbi:MAG: NfeD family protein [Gammaproteobacteria bacterium]|nr:NfeD family protein [Gammaproteobacteria bacterium]